jgi:hypothetical protein
MKRWTAHSLAEELGVDREALARRLRGLEPQDSQLRSNGRDIKYYHLKDVLEFLRTDGNPGDPEQLPAKERLDYYRGCRERDNHRREAGELLHVDEVTATWSKLIGTAKARLLALPSRLAPAVVAANDLRQAEDLLKHEIWKVLEELADSGGEVMS